MSIEKGVQVARDWIEILQQASTAEQKYAHGQGVMFAKDIEPRKNCFRIFLACRFSRVFSFMIDTWTP